LIKKVKTVNNLISQKNRLIHGKMLKANSESLKIKTSLIKKVKAVNNLISQKNRLIHRKMLKANSESLKIKNKDQTIRNIIIKKEIILKQKK
jgi:hypothetical protein